MIAASPRLACVLISPESVKPFYVDFTVVVVEPELTFSMLYGSLKLFQMAFVIVLLQELVQGKSVVQGVQEGDPLNLALLGGFVVSVVDLSGWLAIKGDDDYVNQDLNNQK